MAGDFSGRVKLLIIASAALLSWAGVGLAVQVALRVS